MIREKFKIGDKVKIINRGSLYSSYEKMALYFKLKNWQSSGFASTIEINYIKIYEVIGIQIHNHFQFIEDVYKKIENDYKNHQPSIVLAIEDIENGKQYLIGTRGVKKIYLDFHFNENDFLI